MPVVIRTQKLNKVYYGTQNVHALKNLDLEVNAGEIFAYLGPNGSGKTTTIKMLLGLIFPTDGSIEIMGRKDIGNSAVKQQIGYLPEGAYYPDFLRGEEIVRFYGQLYGLSGRDLEKRIDRVLEQVGMTHARKRLLRGYSKGMRQRIGLAQALISDPQILILDEPTTGLDPIARKEIRDILAALRDEGKTLMISSHELLELELIADRAGILAHGELQAIGAMSDILAQKGITITFTGALNGAPERMAAAGYPVIDHVGDRLVVEVPNEDSLADAVTAGRRENLIPVSMSKGRETLEELFVRVVGEAEAKVRKAKA